jgi:glyoxylase-like metal-dependent hydrolase (beta-lactamase superfamily II)
MSLQEKALKADIQHFYHGESGTFSYVVSDPVSRAAIVIDSVLGFSVVSGRTDSAPADAIASFIEEKNLAVEWILETHAHADHLSAAQVLKSRLGGKIAAGKGIRDVQAHFGPLFNLGDSLSTDGSEFDHLFADNDEFGFGELRCRVMHTPGHTSDSVSYIIGDAAFVGDTVFMTDFGTARCDFPGGDAGLLYDSIQKLFALPDDTMIYLCHDYPPTERELRCATPLQEQRDENIHVAGGVSRDSFVAMRESRDADLALPALIIPSIQVNIRAGQLPEAEDNDIAYIKIPLDTL